MNGFEIGLDAIINKSLRSSAYNDHKCPYCSKEKEFRTISLFGKEKIVPIVCCEWEQEKDMIRKQLER